MSRDFVRIVAVLNLYWKFCVEGFCYGCGSDIPLARLVCRACPPSKGDDHLVPPLQRRSRWQLSRESAIGADAPEMREVKFAK